jgi:hypothetical protein
MSNVKAEKVEIIEGNFNTEETKSKIKRKIRAWCILCYQFFENGPTAKNCQDHLKKGNCNLVECKKGSPHCVRKFPNINSENRHTYCLTLDEVSTWDPNCNIQHGIYKESVLMDSKNVIVDSSDSIFSNKLKEVNNPWESAKLLNKSEGNFTPKDSVNELNQSDFSKKKIESIFSLRDFPVAMEDKNESNFLHLDKSGVNHFDFNISYDKEKFEFFNHNENNFLNETIHSNEKINANIFESNGNQFDVDDSLANEFSKIYFNTHTPEKNKKAELMDLKQLRDINSDNHSQKMEGNFNYVHNTTESNVHFSNSQSNYNLLSRNLIPTGVNYSVKDETGIDELLDRVQIETKIPKTSINKLKTAFRKKGLNTAKLIRLLRNKNKNWNFLFDDFKDVCTQIQGVALYLENILENVP